MNPYDIPAFPKELFDTLKLHGLGQCRCNLHVLGQDHPCLGVGHDGGIPHGVRARVSSHTDALSQ